VINKAKKELENPNTLRSILAQSVTEVESMFAPGSHFFIINRISLTWFLLLGIIQQKA